MGLDGQGQRLVGAYVLVTVGYLAAFVVADELSAQFAVRTGVSVFYLPPGVTLSLLLVGGLRYLPIVPLGPLLVGGVVHPLPVTLAELLLVELSLSGCYALTAWLLIRLGVSPTSTKGMGLFIGIAGLAGPLLNAVVVVFEFVRLGLVPTAEALETTLRFWVGDAIGVLTVTPLFVLAFAPAGARSGRSRPILGGREWPTVRVGEAVAQAGGILGVVWFVFDRGKNAELEILHLSFLPVIWVALRHGVVGAAAGVTLTSWTAVYLSDGHEAPGDVQLFLVTLAITCLLLGAVVTERERAAKQSRRQADKLSAVIQSTTDFVYLKSAEDLRYLTVNDPAAAVVGMSPAQMIGKTDLDLFDTTTAEALRAADRMVLDNDQSLTTEEVVPTPAGGERVVLSSKSVCRTSEGTVLGLIGISRDITELKASQQALQDLADERQTLLDRLVQAQEDERARIAADVHDDSVQALAAVQLRLGLLRHKIGQSAPTLLPGVDQVRQTVSEATTRLRHLLFDLESPAARTDLATALRQAAAYVFEGSDIQWSLTGDLQADLPLAARVTAYRVAKEGMVNARKHASAHQVSISLRRDESGVEVTVADDGVGVDPDRLERLPGHLGLASVRDRARVAGGWVRLESRSGGGAQLRCWLPD